MNLLCVTIVFVVENTTIPMLKFVEVNPMIKYMYFRYYQFKVRPDVNIFDRKCFLIVIHVNPKFL